MNLAQYLEDSARRHPDKAAFRFEGQQITFQEFDIACNGAAHGLGELGLAPGDRAVVMMPNSIQQATTYYALAKIGAIVVPVSFLYRTHELEHILADSKPKAFIGSEAYLEEIRKVFKKGEGPSIRLALGVKQDQDLLDLESVYSDRKEFSPYPADDNETVNLLYTSGTTGVPK
ncbi:MAG: acyl--CoA ligase, partial [Deltaproteobacteria bacterium]